MSDDDGRRVLFPSDQGHGEDDDGNDRMAVNNPDDIPLNWSFSAPSDQVAHGAPAAGDCSLLPGADIPVIRRRAPETDAFEKGSSSSGAGRKRECGCKEVMQIGATRSNEETGEEHREMSDGQCKIQNKRSHSSEIHNLKERLRRKKLKGKMHALQELIPNCNKRDKASTLDDAIKYIKSLNYQLQMVSMGAGPKMVADHANLLPSFVHFMGLGIPGPSPSSTSQSGLPPPCLMPSTATSAPTQLDVTMPSFASSTITSECASRCINPATSHIGPSRDVLPSEQCAMRSPRARVLPSQVILPHDEDDLESSDQWGSSSTSR